MQRYNGNLYPALRTSLPRNLVVFDGHCLMCQDKVRFVLERNFTFFDDAAQARNTLYFTSTAAPDGKEIVKSFAKQLAKLDTVIFVERIPSARGRYLNRSKTSDEKLFSSSSMAPATASSEAAREVLDDIQVSVKSTACFRIMMKLDRWWLRQVGRIGYFLCPKFLSDWVYDQVAKRRTLWGTSEKCAVLNANRDRSDKKASGAWIDGLKERRWIRMVDRPGLGKGKSVTSK